MNLDVAVITRVAQLLMSLHADAPAAPATASDLRNASTNRNG